MACGHAGMRVARRRPVLRLVLRGTGLSQGCVLAPLLFNIFFAVVIHVALTRFEADKDIVDALVNLGRKPESSGRMSRDLAPALSLWGMLYTLLSPNRLRSSER